MRAPEGSITQLSTTNWVLERLDGFLTEFDLPDKWLTAVAGGGVAACKGGQG